MTYSLLNIQELTVNAENKTIIDGLNLTIQKNEIHVIMGPNGSGKSTLCQGIMGNPKYSVSAKKFEWEGKDFHTQKIDERARGGIFLAFQYPREIPGVRFFHMLRTAYAAQHPKSTKKRSELKKDMTSIMKSMGLPEEFGKRAVNENASGGEKKRLEMVQLATLKPKLAILDEIDSGVDVDARKIIAQEISRLNKEDGTAFLIITHDQRLLTHIQPNVVHIMKNGRIVKSGGMEIVENIEQVGYEKL